jgi:hypothetical protein
MAACMMSKKEGSYFRTELQTLITDSCPEAVLRLEESGF